jgi:hypothetical protein
MTNKHCNCLFDANLTSKMTHFIIGIIIENVIAAIKNENQITLKKT